MSETESPANMYSLHEVRELCLRVYYPNDCGQLVLRTDLDAQGCPSHCYRSQGFIRRVQIGDHTSVRLSKALSADDVRIALGHRSQPPRGGHKRGYPGHLPLLSFPRAGKYSRCHYAGVDDSEPPA